MNRFKRVIPLNNSKYCLCVYKYHRSELYHAKIVLKRRAKRFPETDEMKTELKTKSGAVVGRLVVSVLAGWVGV
jgi:hypothetical protein